MTRRTFLAGALTLAQAQTRRPPNIVLILIDDLGWRDLSSAGSPLYQTPNIDALAASGMVFTNGYSACPVCSPTRSAVMTGKYPARTRVTAHLQGASNRLHFAKMIQPEVRLELPLEEVTLAERLKARGYRTAAIGKWHLGKTGFLASDQGFDIAMGGDEAGSTNDFFYPAWKKKIPLEGKDGEYLTDRLTDLAVDFIRASRDSGPYFLYLAHFAVHTPIHAKPDKIRKYEALARSGERHNHATYAAMIESVDESVGRVLKEAGPDTVVLFASDNGGVVTGEWQNRPLTSNLPLRSGKGYLYEGGIRVPTIVRWPGVTKAGSRSDVPVISCDYAPTLCEIAGVPVKGVDGVSVVPALKGGTLPARDLYWHYPHYNPQQSRPGAAIRRGDLKLILFFEDDHVELYDLRNDVGEQHDLAAKRPADARRLRAALEAWLKSVDAQMPVKNARYDPAREWELGEPTGRSTAK